jgi:DNA (cytosine-5)-methyltransferase 1
MLAHHIDESESSFSQLPTVKARDANAEGYEAGLRRSQPQIGTLVKAIVDGDDRLLPTPSTQDNSGKCRDHGGDLLHEFICGCDRSERKDSADEDKLLRTPRASDGVGGALGEKVALERGNSVGIRDQVMDLVAGQGLQVSRAEVNVLPTPTTRDWKDSQAPHERDGVVQTDTVARAIFNSGEVDLMPTPLVDDAKNTGHNQTRIKTLASEVWETERTTNWGKFEPAIRRWEAVTRPAPAPTKPDGKDGNHRLSSLFTEWMMGLPDGWVTGHGLKRNDELKMCGNGVVPQQAVLALRYLLQDVELEKATSES